MAKPTLISLYSGCGGSALGFKNAGFEIDFMNDNNADSCYTLIENFQKTSDNPDRKIIHRGNIKDVFSFGQADVIEGGFPCQGFSLAGPRKVDDKRNILYNYLKRAITFANPKFFVAENVKGFVSIGEDGKNKLYDKEGNLQLGKVASAITSELATTGGGYNVHCKILDAKDYGIPQDRERIIIVGVRKDLDFEFEFPRATHGKNLKPYVTLESIKNIPSLETEVYKEKKDDREDYFSSRYMSRNRIRPWNNVSFTIPADAGQVPADPSCEKMWDTPDGKRPGKIKPIDKKIAQPLAGGFQGPIDTRMDWNEFRKKHEKDISKDLRRLSWRQCAAIQGFPKDYKFHGDVKSIYRQIGNAVPPPMMQQVAQCIMPYFEGKTSSYPKKKILSRISN